MNSESVPAISVIIPAHNAALTVGETLQSVFNQSWQDFEVLVVDDGSTDSTPQQVESVGDTRIQLLTQAQAGPSAARNLAIRRARGEYIAFLDADDLWLEHKLADQLTALREQPDAALVYSWSDSIDEAGNFLKHGNYVRPRADAYQQLIEFNFLDNGSTPMVRRAALLEAGLFDEGLRLAEDWDLWLRLAFRHPIVCVPRVQVLYRVRGSSSSSNVQRQAEGSLQVLRQALQRLPAGRERRQLERKATCNLYQYLCTRLIETADSRRAGITAAGYWWRSVRIAPDRMRRAPRFLLTGCAVLALLVLRVSSWIAACGAAGAA